jgi:hypothetical protein
VPLGRRHRPSPFCWSTSYERSYRPALRRAPACAARRTRPLAFGPAMPSRPPTGFAGVRVFLAGGPQTFTETGLGAVEYLGFFMLPGRGFVPLAFGEGGSTEGYGHGFAQRQMEKFGLAGPGLS